MSFLIVPSQLGWSDDGDVQRASSQYKGDFDLARQWLKRNAGKDSSDKVDRQDKLRTPLLYGPEDVGEGPFPNLSLGRPSPSGPQFGPPKPGNPMPPTGSGKGPSGFGAPNKGGVYGPENPDGSWPSQSDPSAAFGAFDNFNQGPKALLRGGNTPTAAFDSGPQSRNMLPGGFVVDKPVEADGYKSGPECNH
ncbi:MAG: hypothetical protein HY584_05590 [Candidatus Omnitrophica bacterium]|nr:hypothetical protein [Candidatus Omnitrophota bacterium]